MNEAQEAIIREMVRERDFEYVLDEFRKIESDQIKGIVVEEIRERDECPRCGGEVMYDREAGELFCPVDGWNYRFDG